MNLVKILSKSFLFIHEIEFKTYIYILFDITFIAKTLAIKLLMQNAMVAFCEGKKDAEVAFLRR